MAMTLPQRVQSFFLFLSDTDRSYSVILPLPLATATTNGPGGGGETVGRLGRRREGGQQTAMSSPMFQLRVTDKEIALSNVIVCIGCRGHGRGCGRALQCVAPFGVGLAWRTEDWPLGRMARLQVRQDATHVLHIW